MNNDGEAHFKQLLLELDDTIRPDTMKIWNEAEKDMRGIQRHLATTRKRKAWPEWGVPLELLLLSLDPAYRMPPAKQGIGFQEEIDPRVSGRSTSSCWC